MATIIRRKLKDGRTVYDAQIRRRGVTRKRSHRTRAAAERWARKTESKIDDERDVPTAAERRKTVGELLDLYLASPELAALAWAPTVRSYLGWWRERIGSTRASKLSKAAIQDGLAALAEGEGITGRPVSGPTRRRYHAALRAALSWAERRGLIDSNPASKAAREIDEENDGRQRYLRDEHRERERLLEAVDAEGGHLPAMVRLALYTGMRQGEIVRLEWIEVDLRTAEIHLPAERTKARKARTVALSRPAVALLAGIKRERLVGSAHVFAECNRPPGTRPRFPRRAWDRAVERAGLDGFHYHDLRHTYAAYALSEGANVEQTMFALGHSTPAMALRYMKLEKRVQQDLAAKVGERIG